MAKADKSKLAHKRPKVDDGKVTIEGVGDFRIRPLSRQEVLRVYELRESEGLEAAEALTLHLGLTDPTFTLEEVREWAAAEGSSGEIQPISHALGMISGMMPDSGKAAYKSV